MSSRNNNSVSIVLCGGAGQGIQTIESLIIRALKQSGYNLYASKEYMSRIRGGSNSTLIRVSSSRVSAWSSLIDVLFALDSGAVPHLKKRISDETVVLEPGSAPYSNTSAFGMVCGLFKVDRDLIVKTIADFFSKKDEKTIGENKEAALKGYRLGLEMAAGQKVQINISQNSEVKNEMLLNGTDAVALGAIAGGCDFLSAYPMTPGTGVLTTLAKLAEKFDLIVEQAEDEIAAINMAIGAWYAGSRGMVSTSGGGYALMVEGLSLSGMLETPAVIHLSQRPGPATGLPTRTEQADLDFALYSGHGEFPRIILAPGTIEDAFYLTQKAFNLADQFQTPVFILTDQNFVDSYRNVPAFNLDSIKNEQFVVGTKPGYKRYAFSENGISPRGVPGVGEGFVAVDSDEHDEDGRITEDEDVRKAMVEKRLKKMESITAAIIPPELIGPEKYKTLVVGWGSTAPAIKEALEILGGGNISFLYFKQVYPLHPMTGQYLKEADMTVIVENNATSQFGKLIKLHTGHDFDKKILKYNGLPFSAEELAAELKSL